MFKGGIAYPGGALVKGTAERWLGEWQAAEDSANKRVPTATVAGLVIAFSSLLMMFG
jgi:hypothetical protein